MTVNGATRIVSLLPSATEIVCALGLEDRVVGISHSCDYPPSITDRPRLTRPRFNGNGLSSGEIDAAVRAALRDHASVYEIDVAAVEALQPDLVLTQGICDVCAVPEHQAVAALSALSFAPRILALDAHDLAAIFESIRAVGRATGAAAAADTLVTGMQRRLDGVRERVANRGRPRVLALEWLDPPYVPGHWVPELIEIAGGELLAGNARQASYRVEWPMLRALEPSPDVLLIMPCGLSLEETRCEVERYEAELQGLAPTVRCLDAAAYFSRSGPRLIDGLEILASAIFPS